MASARVSWAVAWVIAGCTASAPVKKESEPMREGTARSGADDVAAVTPEFPEGPVLAARSVGVWFGKPPMKQHKFDVRLWNSSTEGPRWLVLPAMLEFDGEAPRTPGGEVAELQIFELSKQPRVVAIKAIGAGAWLLRLPKGGSVTLRGLSIVAWWDDVPDRTKLLGVVARELRIGGVPLATAVGRSLDSESGAEVSAPRDAGDPRAKEFWHPAEGAAAALEIDEDTRDVVTVELIKVPG